MTDFTAPSIAITNQKIVKSASDLSGTLESDTFYLLDGVIDMGSTQITVPQGGLTIGGLDLSLSALTTTALATTLFIDDGVFSGNLFMRDMFIEVSGVGSVVFDLDNAGNGSAFECTNFNFVNCLSLGTLDSYRQGLWDGFATIACVDGLTMEGTWSGGFAIITSIIVSAGTNFTGTLLKKGTSLVVNGSIRSDMNALQLHSTGEICDFSPANITNDGAFLMSGVRVNPASTAFPNMPSTSTKATFSNCSGTDNTYRGGEWVIGTAVATTISTVDTLVKLAGTTTYSSLSGFNGTVSNAFEYESTEPIDINVQGVLSFSGTNNNEMAVQIRQYDDSAAGLVEIGSEFKATLNAAGRVENVSFQATTTLNVDDRIEVWIKNLTGTANITCVIGGSVQISRLSS